MISYLRFEDKNIPDSANSGALKFREICNRDRGAG